MSQTSSRTLIDDLDILFCAVKWRLQNIGDGAVQPPAATALEANNRLCRSVLECVSALDQLHVMLNEEVDRRRELEQVVRDAEAALARAPAELVAVLGLTLRVPPPARSMATTPAMAHAR